ncbi:MAG: Rieske 2Fe-2S domain-containing protein, partial [Oceanospirillales bacterium]|nr:Rieske 2Fe-2S domain-containing protein [Oceanospirillales bacterium]
MEKIAELLRQYRHGQGLPADFYTSKEMFKLDMEQVFKKTWIYAGVVSEFKKKGEFRVVQVDNNSIILVRDQQGEIRAFHNSCRHRGAQICTTEKGNVPNLVCPYHQW